MRSKKEIPPPTNPINITVQEVNHIFSRLSEIMTQKPIERGSVEDTSAYSYQPASFSVYSIPWNDKFLIKMVYVSNSYGNEPDIPTSITLVKPVEKVVTSFEEIN